MTGQPERFRTPREDVNAPDLYIPCMALVTYVLLYGLQLGVKGQFHPEKLYSQAMFASVLLALELGVVKFSGFLLGIANEFALFDFMAVLGYGFVGLLISLGMGLLFGTLARRIAFLYMTISIFFFSVPRLRF